MALSLKKKVSLGVLGFVGLLNNSRSLRASLPESTGCVSSFMQLAKCWSSPMGVVC